MAEIRCPGCGAGIDPDGKFCKYCGALLPSDVQRSEIRIEDVAQLERLKYEQQVREQDLQRKAEEARKRKKQNIIKNVVLALVPVAMYVGGSIMENQKDSSFVIALYGTLIKPWSIIVALLIGGKMLADALGLTKKK